MEVDAEYCVGILELLRNMHSVPYGDLIQIAEKNHVRNLERMHSIVMEMFTNAIDKTIENGFAISVPFKYAVNTTNKQVLNHANVVSICEHQYNLDDVQYCVNMQRVSLETIVNTLSSGNISLGLLMIQGLDLSSVHAYHGGKNADRVSAMLQKEKVVTFSLLAPKPH